jgi:protein-disulfide isomerase
MHRREFLTAGAVAATAFAGCTGGGDGPDGTADGTGPRGTNARADLSAQPHLGPDPDEAAGLIVAFEDPSCTRCRRFEADVVPQIRSNLVEQGDAALVFRGYPVVYDWGEPATRALEATYDRDATAFWALVAHYFDRQDEFRAGGTAEVYPRTREFLAANTDLDAAAVVDDAERGAFDAAVQSDLDAGMAAGAGRTTPHLFFFRDGEYRTKASGSVSYDTVESVLGL